MLSDDEPSLMPIPATSSENSEGEWEGEADNLPPSSEKMRSYSTSPVASPHVPRFEDVGFTEESVQGQRGADIPWGTIIALAIVIVGIVMFVVLLGLGGSGDDEGGSSSDSSEQNTPLVSVQDTESVLEGMDETPMPQTPSVMPVTPTSTLTPTVTTPISSPTPTATATEALTATPSATPTLEPTLDDGGQINTNLNFAQDALSNFTLLNRNEYGWSQPTWFEPAVGGTWLLGAGSEAGSGLILVVFPIEFIEARFGPQAASRLRSIEADLILTTYRDEMLDSGIFFGIGFQDEDRKLAGVEFQLTGINPNTARSRANENRDIHASVPRPIGEIIRAKIRIERDSQGTVTYFVDDQRIWVSDQFFDANAALAPVLYTSSGGIFVEITRLEFDFSLNSN
jgi:hypothetical protein